MVWSRPEPHGFSRADFAVGFFWNFFFERVAPICRHHAIAALAVSTALAGRVATTRRIRFTLGCDDKRAFASPIAAYNGAGSRSPFAAIAPRRVAQICASSFLDLMQFRNRLPNWKARSRR